MLVCAIAFSIAFATILLAHIFERFGYAPCPLCLQERYAYYFGVPATVVAFFAARAESFSLTRVLLVLVGLAFLINAGVGVYHAGVEWKWWAGPTIVLRRDGGGMGPRRRCRRHRASASGELQRGVVAHARPVLRRLERGGLGAARRHRRLRRDAAAVRPSASSLPGLSRQSIEWRLNELLDDGMDARIKSGHDGKPWSSYGSSSVSQ